MIIRPVKVGSIRRTRVCKREGLLATRRPLLNGPRIAERGCA